MKSKVPVGVVRTKPEELVFEVPPPKSTAPPCVEDMEVAQVTQQLSQQLHIEDIDLTDAENPQLCAEYVKDIYQYMGHLEVSYYFLLYFCVLIVLLSSPEKVPGAPDIHGDAATDQQSNESYSS